jgi:hemoglobin-like flavoprotein
MATGPIHNTPDKAPPPDPALMHAIHTSASRLIRLEGTFVRQLYADITSLIPEFETERGWVFCERLVRSVLWAAVTDQPLNVIVDTLRWVGATNRMEGFPESEYASVVHALVRTVRDLSGDNWSASMGSAWITYFLWLQPFLMAGAQQAAARQQAANNVGAKTSPRMARSTRATASAVSARRRPSLR